MSNRIGKCVRILSGLPEFIGKIGTIIEAENYGGGDGPYYRVRLDKPVLVEGVGWVRDDLWQGKHLKTIREM